MNARSPFSRNRVISGEGRPPRSAADPLSGLIALAALGGLGLAGGCSEWDRYWSEDSSPLGPGAAIDTSPPAVAILAPHGVEAAAATPVGGERCLVTIDAHDDVGVREVVLFIDDTAVATLAAPPWEVPWNTTGQEEASTHRLRATATDEAGNTGTSPVVFARVFNEGPEVAIIDPPNGALVKGTLEITAEFPGVAPEMDRVEFLAGARTIGTVTSPPWTVTLDTGTLWPGQNFLLVKATTTLGHVGVSPEVRVLVNNGTPVVGFDFPLPGHTVATRGTLVLEGTAVDEQEGALAGAQMVWTSDLDGEIATGAAPGVSGLSVGTHEITLTGTNAWGTSATVSRTIHVIAEGTYTYCQDIHEEIFGFYACIKCHNPGSSEYPRNLLDFTSYDTMMQGGVTTFYRIVFPCRPESSLIYNKISEETPWVPGPMPPNGDNETQFPPITPETEEAMRVWILEGAPPDTQTCRPI